MPWWKLRNWCLFFCKLSLWKLLWNFWFLKCLKLNSQFVFPSFYRKMSNQKKRASPIPKQTEISFVWKIWLSRHGTGPFRIIYPFISKDEDKELSIQVFENIAPSDWVVKESGNNHYEELVALMVPKNLIIHNERECKKPHSDLPFPLFSLFFLSDSGVFCSKVHNSFLTSNLTYRYQKTQKLPNQILFLPAM